MFTGADFRKATATGGYRHPNQLVGGAAIQAALKETVDSDFRARCRAFPDQLQNERDRVLHRFKGNHPATEMLGSNPVS